MMKILLTGGSGLVGNNILEHIKSKEYVILHPKKEELNLLDYNKVDEYIKVNKPDIIIHAAGLVGGIHANMTNQLDFLVVNLDMGKNLILSAKNNGVKKLINLGSACMYPRNGKNPLKEEGLLNGELEPTNEGYAIAKLTTARICDYISKKDIDLQYKTIIPCNLYGKHDRFHEFNSHIIPAAIRKIHEAIINNNDEVIIWGDGTPEREFLYAEDLADFIYFVIENFEKVPQYINIGYGSVFSINETYKILGEVMGFNGTFINDLSKPNGMKTRLLDDTKILNLGWNNRTDFKEGIKKTYNFYKTKV